MSPSSCTEQPTRICMFPTSRSRTRRRSNDLEQIVVDLPPYAFIQHFLEETRADVSSLAIFSWACILQAYVNNDQPVFGLVDATSDIYNERKSSHLDVSTCCLNLESETPVVNVLRSIQDVLGSSTGQLVEPHTNNGHTANGYSTNGHIASGSTNNKYTLDSYITSTCSTQACPKSHSTINGNQLDNCLPETNRDLKNQGFGDAHFFELPHGDYNSVVLLISKAQQAHSKGAVDSLLRSDVDVVFVVSLDETTLKASLICAKSVLDTELLRHTAVTLTTLITDITEKPLAKTGHLKLCSQADVKLLHTWNKALPEHPPVLIHEVINQTVQQHYQQQAVSAWDGDLTYSELDQLSTLLAIHLISLGVGPEVFVPLYFEKSKWVVVAVMGVMKAGGAFVLLDTSYPVERVSKICNELRATVIVSSDSNASTATALARHVVVPCDITKLRQDDGVALVTMAHSCNALYIVFTSGSTGIPKGVVHEHGAFYAKATALIPVIGFNSASRVLQFASHAFTVSAVDILYTLISGGCICIPSETERMNNLASFINRHSVNLTLVNPAVTDLLDPDSVPSLQTISLAGESVSLKTLRKWGHRVRLTQSHGSSETNGHNTASALLTPDSDPLSIGHAQGCIIWLVSPRNYHQLAPVGAIGEMIFESQALSRGYLNDETKTTLSFRRDARWIKQFRNGKSTRLYSSGDLARRNPDGTLTFMGRKDQQVKINGQRVELTEVEYHVQAFLDSLESARTESVRVVVEVITPCDRERPLLTAFVQLVTQTSMIGSDLEHIMREAVGNMDHRLRDVLPSFMIPGAYVLLPKIPTTLGGKKDRRQLRRIGSSMTWEQLVTLKVHQTIQRIPQTLLESQLQGILGELLHIQPETISTTDSFTHIGGDSIIAMHLVSKAREIGLHFTVTDVFRHSKIADLAQHVDVRSTLDNEVIPPYSLLPAHINVHDAQEQAAASCGVDFHSIEDIYPCTPIQEGLLALTARKPTDYVERRILELQPNVQIDKLREALRIAVHSVPALRTRIVDLTHGGLVQVVIDEPFRWHVCKDLQQYLENDNRQKINIGSALTRFGLVDVNHGCRYLVWTLHHAIYDLWSRVLMDRMVEAIYHGDDWLPLAPFNRFVKHVITRNEEASVDFWNRTFANAEAEVFPPLPNSTYRPHGTAMLELSINDVCWKNTNVTASNVIRAAWGILQARYVNSNDIVFGATVTGRQVPVLEIERLAGATISTVPIRIVIDYENCVGLFLRQIQDDAVDMIPFESLGLQHIRRASDAVHQNCDFQVLLVVQPAEESLENATPLFIPARGLKQNTSFNDDNPFATYAITIVCNLVGKKDVDVRINFDPTVIECKQVERMASQFEFVLRQLCDVENQNRKLSDLKILSGADLNDIWSWNAQTTKFENQLVHELIHQTAIEQPISLAVNAWDGVLTYKELDEMSTHLGHLLARKGVGLKTIVVLCFEKSMWVPVAMLAVMKCGGTSISLDSTQPEERLHVTIKTAEPYLVLSSAANEIMARRLLSDHCMVLNASIFEGCNLNLSLPVRSGLDPSLPLVVNFTSGSTGIPKGTVITHRSYATAIRQQGPQLGMGPGERVYDFASYNFDISWCNALQAFAWGACLCVPSEFERRNDLQGSLIRYESTFAFLTPSVSRILDPKLCTSMKTLALGGEPQRWSDFEHWPARMRRLTIYGPSECTCFSNLADASILSKRDMSVGPASASNTWLLDPVKGDELVPIGCVGELWLEGPLVGEEYLNNPERTKEAFVQDPSWLTRGAPGHPGRSGRLYRTGDLMKYNQDGTLVFTGRKDNQVKIRGQRVELGEVEFYVRREIFGNKNGHVAAEVIKPKGSDVPILMAFVVLPEQEAREELRTNQGDLHKRLLQRVPIYMVPSIYVPLEQISMTPNGKTDRKELRKIGSSLTLEELATLKSSPRQKCVPQSEMEKSLHQLWANILKIDASKIHADDSFFRIGGDSISAMRLVARAQEQGMSFTVADVFKQPVLRDLAIIAEPETNKDVETPIPYALLQPGVNRNDLIEEAAQRCHVRADDIQDIYPCSPLQEGMIAMTAKRDGDYVARFTFEFDRDLDISRFRKAWEVITQEAPIFRTRIIDVLEVGLLQVVVTDSLPWLTGCTDLTTYIEQDSQQQFGLGLPLARFGVVKDCRLGKQFFVWTIHHAIYDGWSISIVIEEVKRIFLQQPRKKLEPYQQFIKHVVHQDSIHEADYWRAELANSNASSWPVLPNALYQPCNDRTISYRSTGVPWTSGDITPSSMIRAGLALLVSQYVDSSDVKFGVTVSGRQASVRGIENIIGPTLATVPVRIKPDMSSKVYAYLHHVQAQAVEMIPFEQTGLQNILDIGPELRRSTDFQTLLVVQPPSERDDSCDAKALFWPAEMSEGSSKNMEGFSQYAMLIICQLEKEGCDFQISFDSNVISEIQVDRFVRQLSSVLQKIVASDQSTNMVELVSASQDDLSKIWNLNAEFPETPKEYPCKLLDYSQCQNIACDTASVAWIANPFDVQHLSPFGAIGELVIEGDTIGQGHLNNAEMPVHSLIDSPQWLRAGHDNHNGRRNHVLRTGNLVRYDEDGSLIYVGSKDDQTSIHGLPVEFSKIEHHVSQILTKDYSDYLSSPTQVVAESIAFPGSDERILIIFVHAILDAAQKGQASMWATILADIQARLTRHVPAHMIPHKIIPTMTIPLTDAGQIDRQGLRNSITPEQAGLRSHALQPRFEAPEEPVELSLQNLWMSVLKLDVNVKIGKDDSFFRLGGDSISAMRLVGAARDLGMSFTVTDVFNNPQLSKLAQIALTGPNDGVKEISSFSLLKGGIDRDRARSQAARLCNVEVRQIQDIYPCTPMQEGLLALTTRRAGDYVRQRVLMLRDDVDIELLHKSVEAIAESEALILRTRVIDLPSYGLVQVLVDKPLPWTSRTNLESHASANEEIALGQPLTHFVVENASKGPKRLVWTIHHALYDAWSTMLLDQAIEAAYFRQARPGFYKYNLFVQHIANINDEDATSYWRNYFNGSQTTVFPATQTPTSNVDKAFDHAINGLSWSSSRSSNTASIALQAAWAILQMWYTGSSDTTFGITVIGRRASLAGIERIAGPTIATVPVRVVVEDDDSLGSLLHKIQLRDTNRIPYEQIGLQKIKQTSEQAKHACRFQTLLVIHPPQMVERKPALFRESADITQRESTFNTYAVTINCELRSDGVDLHFSFDSEAVSGARIEQIARQFELIVRQVAGKKADLTKNVRDMRATSDGDLEQILKWNSPGPRSISATIHSLFRDTVLKQPYAVAIDAWDGTLSYAELDDLTTKLAAMLRHDFNVKPGDIIPLYFAKSMWTSVAIWTVMKTGAASVLLDTSLPMERLSFIAQQVRARIILTSSGVSASAGDLGSEQEILTIDKIETSKISVNAIVLPKIEPSTLLYVVFTSGSTGTPKGVMITHQNFASAIYHQRNAWGLSNKSRVYDFASYSFDVTWHNHLFTITCGGCLCVPSDVERKNDLVGSMNAMKINYVDLTTSVSRLLKPSKLPLLSTLLFGGESLAAEDVSSWANQVKAINTYGPAECAIVTTATIVDPQIKHPNNIGRGLGALTWIVTLDGRQLAPLFTVGELWLEGPLVGNGYLNEPEKTAAVFVVDPSWLPPKDQSGRRFYKTGDLVKYDSDGTLIFIGRKDTQVKIHGQRIELGEIEYHIRKVLGDTQHASSLFMISNVVVETLKPASSDQKQLVAFMLLANDLFSIDSEQGTKYSQMVAEIESQLYRLLPSYMIPAAFVPIDKVPTTVNGKVDRANLRGRGEAMTMSQLVAWSSPQNCYRSPETDTEYRLQRLWSSILKLDAGKIGLDDDFFRLGGGSIEAMRLVASAREDKIKLTVTDVFRHSQLAQLAARISLHELDEDPSIQIDPFALLRAPSNIAEICQQLADLCGVQPAQIEDAFPCTPLQEGLMSLTIKRATDYISKRIFELPSDTEVEKLKSAFQEVFAVTPILRSRMVDLPGQGLVQTVIEEPFDWTLSKGPLDLYIKLEGSQAMKLGTPLFKACLITEPNKENTYLALIIHHALYDGFSMNIMEDLVDSVYSGREVKPSVNFNHFVKYAAQQRNDNSTTEFWRTIFHGSEATSFPSLPSPSYQPKTTQVISDRVCLPNVSQSNASSTATISTAIKAAWAILQGQYTNATDVVFGTVSSGRQAGVQNIERVMGPTITTVPVRVSLDANQSIHSLLEEIQTHAIDSIAFEQIGLQNIKRVSKDAELGCQFQTLLVVQPPKSQSPIEGSRFAHSVKLGDEHEIQALDAFTTYAMTLICQPDHDAVHLHLSFDTTILEKMQAERIIHQFDLILRQIQTANSSTKIRDINVTSERDLRDIWNWNVAVPEPVDECVHEIISQTTSKQPDTIAVCAWDGQLTYRELDELSSELAYQIIDDLQHVSNAVVPLCFEKSVWMTVAILGVMKAGGASVALDVTQPEKRLQAIVSEVNPHLVLCSTRNQKLAHRLSKCKVAVVNPKTVSTSNRGNTTKKLPKVSSSDNLYISFTSGSTGVPKGAVISHSNSASAIKYQATFEGFESTSRVYDFSSYAFDVTWANALKVLSVGGCLCVPSDAEREQDLVTSMSRFQTTFAILTPTLSRVLHNNAIPSLKTLHLVGETSQTKDFDIWKDQVQVFNAYGPSECTPCATAMLVDPATSTNFGIGKGLGCCTWIVNPSNPDQLTLIGGIGELWLEGPIVGQGYLNNSDSTAKSFIENPSWLLNAPSDKVGRRGRAFRTGDLVKYNSDGTLKLIGRKDTQVKIRGQRIELSEVEHHLKLLLREQSDLVLETVVDMITSGVDRKQTLAAFIHLDNRKSSSLEREAFARWITADIELRLAQFLPSFMIPTTFIAVDSIPMTASGKTDRRQLREQASSALRNQKVILTKGYVAPSSEMEMVLCDVLADVLNMKKTAISTDISFVQLGGDSISAMQVISRLRAHYVTAAMSDLLRKQSIRQLALSCRKVGNAALPVAENHDNEEDLDQCWGLSPIQRMFFDHYADGLDHYNQSFLLKIVQPISSSILKSALEMVVLRHPMLRARFQQDSAGIWKQRIAEAEQGVFRVREHQIKDYAEMQSLAQQSQESLHISNGPVFAADLFTTTGGDQHLFLVAHHLVVDLVSWRIIWHDLESSISSGLSTPLPPATTSFSQWCKLQVVASQELDKSTTLPFEIRPPQLEYWGISPEANKHAETKTKTCWLDRDATALLLSKSNDGLRTEPMDILLAMLIYSFRKIFTDRVAPAITIEGHGREPLDDYSTTDLSETVGWFTTLCPLLIPGDRNTSKIDSVKLTKDTRRCIPRKGAAYFASQYLTQFVRDRNQVVECHEILLNYLGAFQQLEGAEALFQTANLDSFTTSDFSPEARRVALINVSIAVIEGQIRVSLDFHPDIHHQSRLNTWIDEFVRNVKHIAYDLADMAPIWTTSDFPLMRLSYDGLRSLESHLRATRTGNEEIVDIYPCTPLQEGILLSMAKGTASYSNVMLWRCEASRDGYAVSPTLLENAWKCVVQRHSILSTIFVTSSEEGKFAQVVLKNPAVKIEHADADQFCSSDYQLQRRPCFNAGQPEHVFTIFPISQNQIVCRLDINHALMDAASVPILVRDMTAIYESEALGVAPPFRQFVKEVLGKDQALKLSYWKSFLQYAQPCTIPVKAIPEPLNDATTEEECSISLPDDETAKIEIVCKQMSITRSTFLQVAWALLLSWFTQIHDVSFGYLASGRDASVVDVDQLIGPLINLLVARIDLDKPVHDILDSTSQQSVEHLNYQHTSLAQIHHSLGLKNLELFNTAITVRHIHETQTGSKHEIQFEEIGSSDPQEYPLGLNAGLHGSSTYVSVTYRRSSVSGELAREVSDILGMAIRYLSGPDMSAIDISQEATSQKSAYDAFFEYVVGMEESKAIQFWTEYFDGSNATAFPTLPSSSYTPETDSKFEHHIRNIAWDSDRELIPISIETAWAILIARLENTTDVIFDTVTTNQIDVASSQHRSSLRRDILPTRVVLGWHETTQDLTAHLHARSASIASFKNLGSYRIRQIAETQYTCLPRTLLSIYVVHDSTSSKSAIDLGSISGYALKIGFEISETALSIHFNFDSTILDPTHVSRLASQFESVLRQILDQDHRTSMLREIEVVSLEDLSSIWSWNAVVPKAIDQCVHTLISKNAKSQPAAIAVSAWDVELTYRQLDNLSTQLAYKLLSADVTANTVVPLFFEKSGWTSVAMLTVMKAGATILLIDVTQPEDRLRTTIEQVRPTIVLSSRNSMNLAKRVSNVHIIVPDEYLQPPAKLSRNQLPKVDPSTNLYIVFTSGSTGVPKGVVISHKNFSTAIFHQCDRYHIHKGSRVFDFASHAFDVAYHNPIYALVAGGCICTPNTMEAKSDIMKSMKELRVTYAELTPAVIRSLDLPNLHPELECLVASGESITQAVFSAIPRSVRVLNAYGPAECSGTTSIAEVDVSRSITENIGRGLGLNTWVVDLENDQQLAPISGIGELWLEGPLVGVGYLNDLDKTAAAFVDDPLWLTHGGPGVPGRRGRLYRTGDLVRYSQDGTLDFVGRRDTQVKIRGQRVELGEIEHNIRELLSAHHRNLQVVAEVAKLADATTSILLAFISLRSWHSYKHGDLEQMASKLTTGLAERLAEKVPSYMVPTAFIPLRAIPMTGTGKTDRRKLREFASAMNLSDVISKSPKDKQIPIRTSRERQLQQIMANVLNVEPDRLTAGDNFFKIGGDSIGAMKLVGAARRQGFSITVADVFSQPKLCDLAKLLNVDSSVGSSEVVPFTLLNVDDRDFFIQNEIRPQLSRTNRNSSISDIYPLAPYQTMAVESALKFPPGQLAHFFVDFPAIVKPSRLEMCCRKIVSQIEILRTIFVQARGQYWQVVLENLDVPFDCYDWEDNDNATFQQVCRQDLGASQRLGHSFLRFMTFSNTKRTRLVTRLSHAQYDGISLPQIFDALTTTYSGQDYRKQPSFARFIQFTHSLQDTAQTYWRTLLKDSTITNLPRITTSTTPKTNITPAIVAHKRIPTLKSSSSTTTPATLFTAACASALTTLTGSTDILFGRLVSGRAGHPLDLQDTIGCCINIIPVRVITTTASNINHTITSIETQLRQSLPFESVDPSPILHELTGSSSLKVITQFQNIDDSIRAEVDTVEVGLKANFVGVNRAPVEGGVWVSGQVKKEKKKDGGGDGDGYQEWLDIEVVADAGLGEEAVESFLGVLQMAVERVGRECE